MNPAFPSALLSLLLPVAPLASDHPATPFFLEGPSLCPHPLNCFSFLRTQTQGWPLFEAFYKHRHLCKRLCIHTLHTHTQTSTNTFFIHVHAKTHHTHILRTIHTHTICLAPLFCALQILPFVHEGPPSPLPLHTRSQPTAPP